MDSPLVSFIIISYNHEHYIEQTLDSIARQTYQNFELILGDDASRDDSVAKFNNWLENNDYRAKKVFHEHNTGLPAMLNECVKLCNGKYIKILAADDYFHPQYLEKCVGKMEALGEEYGMIYTDIFTVDNGSKPIADFASYDIWKELGKEQIRTELKKINKISAASAMMSAKALHETGPYNEKILVEDYDRWLRINEKYWICYLPEKLVYYRRHTENVSSEKYHKLFQEGLVLRMQFNKNGENKVSINGDVRNVFLENKKLPEPLRITYLKYPYREKLLYYAVKFGIPPSIYLKIRNRMSKN